MPYTVIGSDGKEYGPIELAQLQAWLNEGRLIPDSQVRDVATGQQGLLSSVTGIQLSSAPGSSQSNQYAAYPRQAVLSDIGVRPKDVTYISIFLGVISLFLLLVGATDIFVARLEIGILLILASIGYLVSCIGLWLMKKWAVFCYGATMVAVIVTTMAFGHFSPFSLIIPSIFMIFLIKHFPKMT